VEKKEIPPKQKRFCDEYLIDLNGTQAAIRAGYSARTAQAQSTKMLLKPLLRAYVDERIADRAQRTEITQDKVIAELALLAFGRQTSLMDWGPDGVTIKDSSDLTDDIAAAVSEVSETTTKDGGTIRVKIHDKVKALELLGRHLGIFEKDNKQRRPLQTLSDDELAAKLKEIEVQARSAKIIPMRKVA
jgi:phage terminase small subunit